VCLAYAGFHDAERMLDCFATLTHGVRVCIEAMLHSLEQVLMLSSRILIGIYSGMRAGAIASASLMPAVGVLLWQIGKEA
jgi:hypothetical protein